MKPVILTFTAFYLPGYRGGGPIRTIANMVERMSDDFDFYIVTTDRDLQDQTHYQDVDIDAWNSVGKAKVFYMSPEMRSLRGMTRLIRETKHDLMYVNSFFDSTFTLIPMLALRLRLVPRRPVVVAPRGEFSQGAFDLKSWKKKPFINIVRLTGLFNDVTWHASTELEFADIQRVMCFNERKNNLASNISIAPDLLQTITEYPVTEDCDHPKGAELRICFLSRISPKKNLEYALLVLGQVKVPVQFNIYGPKEVSGYWEKCVQIIDRLPKNVKVTYCGSVEHNQVRATLASHDIFFLPTLGENFGHVFIEALSAGVPILVSDQTPWLGLKQKQLGWDIPLERVKEFVDAIEEAATWSAERRQQLREYCIDFSNVQATNNDVLEMNKIIFIKALEH